MKRFSQITRDLLVSANVSEQQLADALQVPIDDVESWKTGDKVPEEQTLERMSRWYGLELKTLKKSASMLAVHQGIPVAEKTTQGVAAMLFGSVVSYVLVVTSFASDQMPFTLVFVAFSGYITYLAIRGLVMPSTPILASEEGFVIRYSQFHSTLVPYRDVTSIYAHQYRSKNIRFSYGRIAIQTERRTFRIGNIADVVNTSDSMLVTLTNHTRNKPSTFNEPM